MVEALDDQIPMMPQLIERVGSIVFRSRVDSSKRVGRRVVLQLENAMRELPQVELPTDHLFADGMYARKVFFKAGIVAVGKMHKRGHFFIVTKGVVEVAMDDGKHTMTAGTVLVSKPGAKRALFATENAVYMTVHCTNKRNLDKIEAELIEPDRKALFDASNKFKVKELT